MSKEEQAIMINALTKEMTVEEKADRIIKLKANIVKLINIIDNYTEVERRIYWTEAEPYGCASYNTFFSQPWYTILKREMPTVDNNVVKLESIEKN